MSDFLVFTLSATIASMGDLAGHERRGTYGWPGRSALTGLIGAALGLKRSDDFTMIDEMGMAVAVFTSGSEAGFRDYHTVETIPSAKAKQPNSRPEALRSARGATNTSITLRDYRTGFLGGVVLWNGPLDAICTALRRPKYALYLGRKSCCLSAPVAAQKVSAKSPEEAMTHVKVPVWCGAVVSKQMMTDADDTDSFVEVRHDLALDRNRWHFAPRKVGVRAVNITPEVLP